MTKDEIYEHLAKVYLGKKKKKKKRKNLKFYSLLFINALSIPLIIALIVGGINSRAVNKGKAKPDNSLLLALNYYPLRISYDFTEDKPQVQDFTLNLPEVDITKYSQLNFSLKGAKRNYPAILKITLENKRREKSSYYLSHITNSWQKVSIPLSSFKELTDLSNLIKISFVLESWNQNNKNGSFLVDDLGFSAPNQSVRESSL